MSEAGDKVAVKGYKVNLSENRTVEAGKYQDGPDYYVRLMSKEGRETAFSLSPEAADALCQILLMVLPSAAHSAA